MRLKSFAFLLCLMLAAASAFAQEPVPSGTRVDVPWLSWERLSIGLGADHAKDYTNQATTFTTSRWEAGAYFAYSLGPHVAATGSVVRNLSDDITTSRIGVRVVVFRGAK